MSELSSMFYSIPPFTRTYLVILLLTGFGGSWRLLDPYTLIFSIKAVVNHFQVRRIVGFA